MHSTRKPTMNLSIPSVLLSLWGKCLLNWVLVFLQQNHICGSFMSVFSVSLSVIDTTLTLVLTAIHLHWDQQFFLFGLQLTRYHICLLVQIVGQIYNSLHFPVIVVAGLDHFYTVSQRSHLATSRRKWMVHLMVTTLLWPLAALYIFLLSDFIPVLEDVSHHQIHQCWTFHTGQILHVALLIFLTVAFAALHRVFSMRFLKNSGWLYKIQSTDWSRTDSSVISQTLYIFLNTWAIFFLVLATLFLLSVAIPSYLGLNVAWLCFLNSFLIGVVLSVVCPNLHTLNTLAAVPPDSFCEWRFKCNLPAENRS